MYLEAVTPDHGVPTFISRDPERGSWLEPKPVVDYGHEALENYRQGWKPMPGERLVLLDTWEDESATTNGVDDESGDTEDGPSDE